MRRIGVVGGGAWGTALANAAAAAGHDVTLWLRDPEAAARLLGELDRILRESPPPAGRPQSRQVRRPELDGLLAENPLLQEAYRIDPKSALTQLREIVQIGGGK